MAGMWVVWNRATGESTEEMRFPAYSDAMHWRKDNEDPDYGDLHVMRWESDSPHPQNEVALGQIWRDGRWLDFARATPEQAIEWAQKEPVGLARVVDWIGKRDVIWP